MAVTISPADHADLSPEESQQTYYQRHPESSEVAGSKSLHDLFHMRVNPCLDRRALRGGCR